MGFSYFGEQALGAQVSGVAAGHVIFVVCGS